MHILFRRELGHAKRNDKGKVLWMQEFRLNKKSYTVVDIGELETLKERVTELQREDLQRGLIVEYLYVPFDKDAIEHTTDRALCTASDTFTMGTL